MIIIVNLKNNLFKILNEELYSSDEINKIIDFYNNTKKYKVIYNSTI